MHAETFYFKAVFLRCILGVAIFVPSTFATSITGKAQLFENKKAEVYDTYRSGNCSSDVVVVIFDNFTHSYEARNDYLTPLCERIQQHHEDLFAIAYMNFGKPDNLGFIIFDEDFVPALQAEILTHDIPPIVPSTLHDVDKAMQGLTIVPVDELQIAQGNEGTMLCTVKVRDCVALTVQEIGDKTENKAIQLGHYYHQQSAEHFIDQSLDGFHAEHTAINIISKAYSKHLLEIINQITRRGFHISGIYVPEICVELIGSRPFHRPTCTIYSYPLASRVLLDKSLFVGLTTSNVHFGFFGEFAIDDDIHQEISKRNSSAMQDSLPKQTLQSVIDFMRENPIPVFVASGIALFSYLCAGK